MNPGSRRLGGQARQRFFKSSKQVQSRFREMGCPVLMELLGDRQAIVHAA